MLRDAAIVRWAVALVVHRAARLSACAIATVAIQMGYVTCLGKDARPAPLSDAGGRLVCDRCRWKVSCKPATSWLVTNCMAGCDSLYQHYPGFEEHMLKALRVLLGEEVEKQVDMGLKKDRSGIGGACH